MDYKVRVGQKMSFTVIAAAILMVLAGCHSKNEPSSSSGGKSPDGKPVVFVSNYPLLWMTRAIAGDKVDILAPWAGLGDPAYWEPEPRDVSAMQESSLILLNGATYEQWRSGISLPESRVVLTAQGFKDRWIEVEDAVVHSHGPDGDHSHAGTAFTTWLDLNLARQQMKAVHEALLKLVPDAEDNFTPAWQDSDARLAALEQKLKELSPKLKSTSLLGSHPVYQYLARAGDLTLRELHWEPDSDPGDPEWKKLEESHKNAPYTAMLWEYTPISGNVAKLDQLGIRSITFTPVADRPENGGDFPTIMESNINNLASLLQ